MTSQEAAEVLQALVAASHACLDHLGIPRAPKGRTRPWRTPGGPEGIAYHYTGGFSGLKSLHWFNDPSWKNEESSAHVLVFDRVTPELELWTKQEVSAIFRIPTLVIAELSQGTWCTNWANSRCLGVENRNGGYSAFDEKVMRKPRVWSCGKHWEPYTREQMEANVQLGRLFRALRGDAIFKPEWVVGHDMIWATKRDPGSLFPLHLVRQAIWNDEPVSQLGWLAQEYKFPAAPAAGEDEQAYAPAVREFRGDPARTEASWDALPAGSVPDDRRAWLCDVLWWLGWPTKPEAPTDDQLKAFVSYFQRSTLAYKSTHPEKVLAVDGVVGPNTRRALKERLAELRSDL